MVVMQPNSSTAHEVSSANPRTVEKGKYQGHFVTTT